MEEKQETEEQKRKRMKNFEKQVIVLFVVLGLVFISFLAVYQFMKPSNSFKYYGMTVYISKVKGSDAVFYVISVSDGKESGEIILRNDPRKLNVSVQADELLSGLTKAWITMPPKAGADVIIAGNDLGIFTTRIGLDTEYALTEETNDTGVSPIISCENATNDVRVFLIETGNETKVYEQGKCIIINGASEEETIKAADALIMRWLLKIKQ